MGVFAKKASRVSAIGLVTLFGSVVSAEAGPDITFSADLRARWEVGNADDGQRIGSAVTLRYRPTLDVEFSPRLSFLIEGEAIAALTPDSRNGVFAPFVRPGIADAETLEINRVQAQYAPTENLVVTAGRQRVSLDDERFIGIVDFRQNQQTYDAITASLTHPSGISAQGGYIWQVNRIFGPRLDNGIFDSESFFVETSAPTPIGQISAYHFNLDLDDSVAAPISSETTGLQLSGRRFFGDLGLFWKTGLAYQAESDADLFYAVADTRLNWRDLSASIRYERLGSDDGIAFQTPLGTLHRFQGAVDVFLTTPDNGLEDLQISGVWRIGSLGPLRATRLNLQYNRFESATGSNRLGQEYGVEIAARLGANTFSAAFAAYEADTFSVDTSRFWLTYARRF